MIRFFNTLLLSMNFPQRLAVLRKQRKLTQTVLAEQVGVHLTQIQRYENGSTQPTLDIIRKLSIALSISADMLIFDESERGPDDGLKWQFDAIRQFDKEDRLLAEGVLEGLILKHQAKQSAARQTGKR